MYICTVYVSNAGFPWIKGRWMSLLLLCTRAWWLLTCIHYAYDVALEADMLEVLLLAMESW